MFTRIEYLIMMVAFLFGLLPVEAQYKKFQSFELHMGAGTVNLFGDLGGKAGNAGFFKNIQIPQTRPVLYLAARRGLSEELSVKANFFAGASSGTDADSKNATRNYSFSGWLFEVSGQLEWNFVNAKGCVGTLFGASEKYRRRESEMMTRVYLFGGVGMVYALADLDTHGKELAMGTRSEYSKSSTVGLVIPVGIGVRSDISPYWAVGLELGRHFCTSDYLDGFSSDWSKGRDTYYLTSLHVIYKFRHPGRKRPPISGRR